MKQYVTCGPFLKQYFNTWCLETGNPIGHMDVHSMLHLSVF